MSPAYYMVVDLEATCSDDGTVAKHAMEIIEIGAIMLDGQSFAPISEYQTFVRPIRHPRLTAFCTSLTSIRQVDVDTAPEFPEALERFRRWAFQHDGFQSCLWGDYDRVQLEHDCSHHNVSYPFSWGHLNLKAAFSERQGLKKKYGMAEALRIAGIELVGIHHRGIDDARNIATLVPFVVGEKRVV